MSKTAAPSGQDSRPQKAAGASGTGRTGPYEPDAEIHLLDRLAVVYRYRTIAASVFVLTTLAIMIQGYTAVPMYEARAQIQIEDERSTAVPGLNQDNQFYEDPEPYYNTQYRILRGRDLVRKVVKKLQLEKEPEFNGTAKAPETPITVLRELGSRVMGALGPGKSPVPAADERRPDESSNESPLIDAFTARLAIDPIRGSHLVEVAFQSMDPQLAARCANALAREYVDQNLQIKLESTQSTLEWLDQQVANQQKKVQESEQALASYRERQNAMSLVDKQNIIVARVTKMNEDVVLAKTKKARAQVAYDQIRSLAPDALGETPAIAQNPSVVGAKAKLNEALRNKTQVSERYEEKHPNYQKAIAEVTDAQSAYQLAIASAARAIKEDYETAALEEDTFTKNFNVAKSDVQDLNKKSVDYNVLERETNSNQQVYQSLLQKENELRVASNSHTNNVRLTETAEPPKSPTAGHGRSWPVALTLALVLAIAVPFGLDYINDTVKTPEDIERRLKLPFLGLVPSVRGDKHPVLASANVPHDFGESFRSLRTALLAKYDSAEAKILLFTSAQPLEGKTTTAINVAMALAFGGARVLVIDADMRRPGMHRPLRLNNERGLSQVLVGQARVRDVIQRTVDPNLLAITAGALPPNPSELLTSERMKTFLQNLSHGPFDWIIIDTPPVLAVTDAVVLAPLVSGVTFVIGAEMTRRRLAERAVDTIMATHPKQIAAILNRVDFARNRYYYSRYYGPQYKNYYAQASVV